MAEKKAEKKGPPTKGIWKLYEKKGDKLERKNKSCPKCGQGFFMAQHEGRLYCGGCGYTEFQKPRKS
jgi:small subunit ribosomal protein S27Ae